MTEEERIARIAEIEALMCDASFWSDSNKAQVMIKELQELKDFVPGKGKYDSGDAVMTIFAGAGGDDAEDFVAMLLNMYKAYIAKRGWQSYLLSENENNYKGYRSISLEIKGKNVNGKIGRAHV